MDDNQFVRLLNFFYALYYHPEWFDENLNRKGGEVCLVDMYAVKAREQESGKRIECVSSVAARS